MQTTLDTSLVTAHSQSISNLSTNTTYYFRVKSIDATGRVATSANFSFTSLSSSPGINSGLRGYWAFDEGAGLTTFDGSGNSNSGILVNNPAWTIGKVGKAIRFNATDNGNDDDDPRVSIGTFFDVPQLPFTLTAWVNPASFLDWRAILSKRDQPYAFGMRLDIGLSQGSGQVYLFTGQDRSFLTFDYAPPTNVWTHLAIVATATDTTIYVNGVLRQTLGPVTLGGNAKANTVIGGTGEGPGGDNDPFNGAIDEVRVYDRALSASEVQQVYTFTTP
jgi:hypothetical protein